MRPDSVRLLAGKSRLAVCLLWALLLIVGTLFLSPATAVAGIRQLAHARTPDSHCTRTDDGMGHFSWACNPLPQSLTVSFQPTVANSMVFMLAHWSINFDAEGSMGTCIDNLGQDWLGDNGESITLKPPSNGTMVGISSVTCQTAFPTPPRDFGATGGEWGVLILELYEVTGVPFGISVPPSFASCSIVPQPNKVTILSDYTGVTPNYSSNPSLGDAGVLGASDSGLLTLEWPPEPNYSASFVLTSIHATRGPTAANSPMSYPNATLCLTLEIPQIVPGADSGVNLGACESCEKVAGSPINLTNGNVYIQQRDYALPGLGGGITLDRTWNGLWPNTSHGNIPTARMFGHSWTSNFEERMVVVDANTVDYWRGDGSKWRFTALLRVMNLTLYGIAAPSINVINAGMSFDSNTSQYSLTIAHRANRLFDSAGYPISITDSNGNVTSFTYDAQRRLTQIVDPALRSLTFAYGDPANPNQVTSIQDSVGTIATYQYDGSSRLFQVTYADGSFNRFNYDANSLILSVTDTEGKILEAHAYDVYRRGLSSERADGVERLTISYPNTSLAILVDSKGNPTQYPSTTINQRNELTSVSGSGCVSCGGRGNQQFFYNSGGQRTSLVDASLNVTQFTYGSYGVVTRRSTMVDGSEVAWSYTYNDFDEVLTATDPLGNTTTNTYDTKGNLLTNTAPSLGGHSGPSTTSFTYDTKGQILTVTDPLNHVTTYTYTSAGLPRTITDAQGKVTSFEYDDRGNRLAVVDPLQQRIQFTYDIMNRLTGVIYLSTTPPTSSSFTYDTRGRRITATDANGKTTTYTYDDADRMISVADAATPPNVTHYEYDSENNLINVIDPLNRITHFDYDENGRLLQTQFPSLLTETYTYDAVGNMTSKTDRKQQTIFYSYDVLRRLTQKRYPDQTQVNYTYDLASRLTQASDPTGTYQFTYDNMGRVIQTSTVYSSIVGRTFTVGYEYDAATNLTTMTDPQGGDTIYTYDTLNRLLTLKNPQRNQFNFAYDVLGRRTQLARPNKVNTNYQYDSLSKITSLLHQFTPSKGAPTTLDGTQYSLDSAGNRVSKTDQRTNVVSNYGYDPLYELTSVIQAGNTVESYVFDPVGNRLSSLGVAYYSYNPSNQLTNQPGVTYTYDYNGNLATKSGASPTTYIWDYENRLTQVSLPAGSQVNFKYDPMGRRIQRSSSSGTLNYIYDGENVLEEVDAAGNLVARYTQGFGMDEPLAMLRSGTTSYYEADGLGSITSLSNSSGALVSTNSYDSFGNLISSSGSVTNPYRYAGRELDSQIGLYYNRARYYDPAVGRFVSEDPLGLSGGANFYAYVRNNPTNLTDPLGLRPGDKYPSRRCAGWNAGNEFDAVSRRRNLEYGGFIYQNPDGTFSYTDPSADGAAGIGTPDSIPRFWSITIPAGTTRAGWYHTHASFDPRMNAPGNPAPGQPGYNWHNDGNEVFSGDDMTISDVNLRGLPGYLATPRGTVQEYLPVPGRPGAGRTTVLNPKNCGC
jgi:RHS repeat-associated protein